MSARISLTATDGRRASSHRARVGARRILLLIMLFWRFLVTKRKRKPVLESPRLLQSVRIPRVQMLLLQPRSIRSFTCSGMSASVFQGFSGSKITVPPPVHDALIRMYASRAVGTDKKRFAVRENSERNIFSIRRFQC